MSDAGIAGRVWTFVTVTSGQLVIGMTHSLAGPADHDFLSDCRRRNELGESLSPECFPERIWPSDATEDEFSNLPDIFFAGSYWVVSEYLADILRGFDLGGAHLYPVAVLTEDRRTPVKGGPWYCFNFGNQKHAFIPEQSRNLRKKVVNRWTLSGTLTHDDLVFGADAASGPDIWIDPALRNNVFFSARLGDAINASLPGKHFSLLSCLLVRAET